MSAQNQSRDDVSEFAEALRPRSPWYARFILLPLLMAGPGALVGLLAVSPDSAALSGAALIGFVVFAALGCAVFYRTHGRYTGL